ncbi:MAG: hypothetical protein H6711_18015 [Myxococcales bacterium]|nr:hypothetical protein [Myxococcales bacterium]
MRIPRTWGARAIAALVLVAACGDDGGETRGSDGSSATATASATATTSATATSAASASEGSGGSASEGSSGGSTSAGTDATSTSSGSASTSSSTGVESSGAVSSSDASSSSGSTGEAPGCDLGQVPDTLGFTFAKKFDTGIPDPVLQATYYNTQDDEVMVMSFSGKARRMALDGTPLADVIDVPPEAQPKLDGATYDPVNHRGLLITQGCMLVEVEPQTLQVIESQQLGFGMSICAGLALGLDNNLYIASYGTDEMVVLSRDGKSEIRRVDMIAKVQLDGFDGITLIAGSENFLVMSTSPAAIAAIIDGFGNVIVPVAPIGQAQAPLKGGMPSLPDAVLTICGNGHAWLCEAYNSICFDYVPDDGDKDACPCLIPQ